MSIRRLGSTGSAVATTLNPYQSGMVITSTSDAALGAVPICVSQGGSSAVWPAASRIYYVPFIVDVAVTVKQMLAFNGTAVAGNVDLGVYDSTGTSSGPGSKLVSTGATAAAGTSVVQAIDCADTALSAGLYWMAMLATSGTHTNFRSGANVNVLVMAKLKQEAGGASLPNTATPADAASSYLPLFGCALAAVV